MGEAVKADGEMMYSRYHTVNSEATILMYEYII